MPIDPPETLEESVIHDGPRFTVRKGRFRYGDGSETEREWVDAPDAVAIVAYDEDQLYLIRQPREAIGRADVLELPAGLMDVEGERPIDTARRELREETGFEADHWVHATTYFSSSGFTDEQVHVFLATGLTKVAEADADGAERIELVAWPLDELGGLIDGNADAATLVGLQWLDRARLADGGAGR
jgi:8-oxo-dGTP pyrophosphatase MutT (NUDIX family)